MSELPANMQELTLSNKENRTPNNLQGLLKFALEATRSEDAPPTPANYQPMDEERRLFLENTLSSMLGNPTGDLRSYMTIIAEMEQMSNDGMTEEKVQRYVTVLENITDIVGDIDLANSFHQIGGLAVFGPTLYQSEPEIHIATCDLLAELSQNNPHWQDAIMHTDIISQLLEMLQDNLNEEVSRKCLYALSCITREHDSAYKRFVSYGGITVLKEVILRYDNKQREKAARLLTALCRFDGDLPYRLYSHSFIPTLVQALTYPKHHISSHTQIVELLDKIVTAYPQSMESFSTLNVDIRNVLRMNIDRIKGSLDETTTTTTTTTDNDTTTTTTTDVSSSTDGVLTDSMDVIEGENENESESESSSRSTASENTVKSYGDRVDSMVDSGVESIVESGVERVVESGVERVVESGVEGVIETGVERAVESGVEIVETPIKTKVESGVESKVEGSGGVVVERPIKTEAESLVERVVESGVESRDKTRVERVVESRVESGVESRDKTRVERVVESRVESKVEGCMALVKREHRDLLRGVVKALRDDNDNSTDEGSSSDNEGRDCDLSDPFRDNEEYIACHRLLYMIKNADRILSN